MNDKYENMVDRYDEMELMELGQEDVYGGSTWACATVSAAISVASAVGTAASAAACPTTKCSSKC